MIFCESDGVVSIDGKRNVSYLWSNSSERNLNLNWFDNDWNSNYRFLAVRMSPKQETPFARRGFIVIA